MPDATKIGVLQDVLKKLKSDFGTWEVTWGEINRFQRIENSLKPKYEDNQPSIPSPFASSTWGSLPSYNSRAYANTKKRYGYGGNSFVCAVEFGKRSKQNHCWPVEKAETLHLNISRIRQKCTQRDNSRMYSFIRKTF